MINEYFIQFNLEYSSKENENEIQIQKKFDTTLLSMKIHEIAELLSSFKISSIFEFESGEYSL